MVNLPLTTPLTVRMKGQSADVGNVVFEWVEYIVACEGADALRVGTEVVPPIVASHFAVRFENRLGYSTLQPLRAGVAWGPSRRVEVVSPKLGAYEAHRAFTDALINRLYRHGVEKVFDFAGTTNLGAAGPQGRRSLLFALHYLVLVADELLAALDTVCERPHMSLVERRDIKRTALISRGGRELVESLLRGRGTWDPARHLATGRALGGFLPSHVETVRGDETTDNPENRFVLMVLSQLAELIQRMQDAAWWKKVPEVRRTRLTDLRYALIRRTDHPSFADVESAIAVPSQSRVLTRREGYRQLYSCWSVLSQAAAPLLSDIELAVELRTVDKLYEQWCFFELADQIAAALKETPEFRLSSLGPLAWNATAKFLTGELVYNATQCGYSLPFRPDLTWKRGAIPVAVFDAKFRAEMPDKSVDAISDPRRADLDKMHAYRDALGIASAVVLYPGSELLWFPATPAHAPATDLQGVLDGWSGIGAMSFRPEVSNGH